MLNQLSATAAASLHGTTLVDLPIPGLTKGQRSCLASYRDTRVVECFLQAVRAQAALGPVTPELVNELLEKSGDPLFSFIMQELRGANGGDDLATAAGLVRDALSDLEGVLYGIERQPAPAAFFEPALLAGVAAREAAQEDGVEMSEP